MCKIKNMKLLVIIILIVLALNTITPVVNAATLYKGSDISNSTMSSTTNTSMIRRLIDVLKKFRELKDAMFGSDDNSRKYGDFN